MGFLDFEDSERRATSLDDKVRQVVILSVGSVWGAVYELYTRAVLAREAGFSVKTLQALENGEVSKDLTEKKQLAQRYTPGLTSQHSVDATTYEQAGRTFGTQGLIDIAALRKVSDHLHASQRIRHSAALTNREALCF
jgi:4-carboxymuconolactone decarboxylase